MDIIKRMLSLPDGTPGRRATLVNSRHAQWVATFATSTPPWRSRMRKGEVALSAKASFGGHHLSRAALAWRIAGRCIVSCPPRTSTRSGRATTRCCAWRRQG